jgi:hypothetical protein
MDGVFSVGSISLFDTLPATWRLTDGRDTPEHVVCIAGGKHPT